MPGKEAESKLVMLCMKCSTDMLKCQLYKYRHGLTKSSFNMLGKDVSCAGFDDGKKVVKKKIKSDAQQELIWED